MASDAHVVDASAALKWVIEESGSEAALKLLEGEALFAPDFLLVEVANVLWSKGRRGVLTREQVEIAYEAVASAPLVLVPLGELIPAARTLAFALDVTVYDALYAALAQRLDCPLATADERLAGAMARSGGPGRGLLVR